MGKEVETLKKNHEVYILTFAASAFDEKLKAAVGLDVHYHSVKINHFTRLLHVLAEPWMPNYFAARSSFRFAVKLICLVKQYRIQAIHGEYASMGQYMWIKKMFPGLVFNLTEHDMTAQSYERKLEGLTGIKKYYFQCQLRQIIKYEKRYCQRADTLFTFNQKDKMLIKERYGRSDCRVLNPYYGLEDEMLECETGDKCTEYANICFLGQMGRDENYLAALRLIKFCKKVKKLIPELQVYIVGNQPPEDLKQQENEYIHVTGFVEDVDEYLKRACLAVFPLTLGAGIKLKVLRSLALGTPVITTAVGAEGIDEAGEAVLLAETDEEFQEKIVQYIKDDSIRKRIGEESRRFVREHFAWRASERVLGEVYGRKE